MFKYFLGLILAASLSFSQGHCKAVEFITGKIVEVDVEGGLVNVETVNGIQVFYFGPVSALYMAAHHMSAIEIEKDDPVSIEFTRTTGKKIVLKLTDNRKPI